MSRYIDAELLESKYREGTDPQDPYSEITYLLPEDIESTPTADVEPVRHGRWIVDEVIGGMQDYKCSVCGAVISETFMMQYNGCPYCLAKMDGGGK